MEIKQFKDRQSLHPGRKKLTIINQEANTLTVDEEWADSPSIEGSLVNAAVLTEFQNGIVEACNNSKNAEGVAASAKSIAQGAETKATNALSTAQSANTTASSAKTIAQGAETKASSAKAIAEDALNKVETFNGNVDNELSSTSINPIQNRAVTNALNTKISEIGGKITGTLVISNTNPEWVLINDEVDVTIAPKTAKQESKFKASTFISQNAPIRFVGKIQYDNETIDIDIKGTVMKSYFVALEGGIFSLLFDSVINMSRQVVINFFNNSIKTIKVSGKIYQCKSDLYTKYIETDSIITSSIAYSNSGKLYPLATQAAMNNADNNLKSKIESESAKLSGDLTQIQSNLQGQIDNIVSQIANIVSKQVDISVEEIKSYYATWKAEIGNLKIIGGATPASEGKKNIYFKMNGDTENDVFDNICLGLWSAGRWRTECTANGWQYTYINSKSEGYILQIGNGSYWFAIGI